MTPKLQTPRLLLRPVELADTPQIQAIFPHWEVVRYLNKRVPWPYPPDGADTYYRDRGLPAIERGEQWHWTLRLKVSPHAVIGCIALSRSENKNRWFWLGLPWHRQGLMSEACEVVTRYWFDELNFPVLRALKAIVSTPSRRISEKPGMRVISTTESDYVSGRLPTEIWEITAAEWRSQSKAGSGNQATVAVPASPPGTSIQAK
ncbi:MAG: GNAT family N-acetyltransferase [Candidatus Acidiferrales bacterium]